MGCDQNRDAEQERVQRVREEKAARLRTEQAIKREASIRLKVKHRRCGAVGSGGERCGVEQCIVYLLHVFILDSMVDEIFPSACTTPCPFPGFERN